MAIAYVTSAATSTAGYTATKSLALDTTGQTNVAIVVFALVAFDSVVGQGEDSSTAVDYNGTPLTAGTEFTSSGVKTKCKLWYGTIATGGNFNINGTWASGLSQPVMVAAAWSGVGSIANENRATAVSTTPSVAMTTTAGNLAVAVGTYTYVTPPSGTPGTGDTERYDGQAGGNQYSGYAYEKSAVGASTTVDWTISTAGGTWEIAGVSLTAAGAAAAVPQAFMHLSRQRR